MNADCRRWGEFQCLEKKFPNIGKKLSGGGESFNKMMNSKIISNSRMLRAVLFQDIQQVAIVVSPGANGFDRGFFE